MITPTVKQIEKVMGDKGYAFFTNGEFNINLIGIRKDDTYSDKFDDTMCLFYRIGDAWHTHYWDVTTESGFTYAEKPLNSKGNAVLVPGQYRGAYRIGYHKSRKDHRAFIQNKPVTVWRDNNFDHIIDKVNPETGMYGINIHRAGATGVSQRVSNHSAGCQVFQVATELERTLRIADRSVALYGPNITYTLLEESDF